MDVFVATALLPPEQSVGKEDGLVSQLLVEVWLVQEAPQVVEDVQSIPVAPFQPVVQTVSEEATGQAKVGVRVGVGVPGPEASQLVPAPTGKSYQLYAHLQLSDAAPGAAETQLTDCDPAKLVPPRTL